MGKRKKKKNKERYNLTQFIAILCKQCKYCNKQGVTDIKASFCYSCYKNNPRAFLEKSLPILRKSETTTTLPFEEVFCESCNFYPDIMGWTEMIAPCNHYPKCLITFKKQIGEIIVEGKDLKIKTFSSANKKIGFIKQKKEEYRAPIPYPTLFYKNNQKEWETIMRDAIDEDCISKQNNDTQSQQQNKD